MATKTRSMILKVGSAAVLIAVILSIAITLLASSQRSDREREASSNLKFLSSAEADFRANDLDWNHVNDFWTADVKGLYTMTSAAVPGSGGRSSTDPSIKLIELPTAAADADAVLVPAGGENVPLSVYAASSARHGYWYAALLFDRTVPGTESMSYKLDTGGTPSMGSCHNAHKFGFVSFPDSQSEGKYVFIINENNTVFRSAVTVPVRLGCAMPPGLNGVLASYLEWPSDEVLMSPRAGQRD